MQIAQQKIGDTSILVTPDGNPVTHKDSEDYVLHIFPRLYAPYDDVGCDNLALIGAQVQNHDGSMIDVLPNEVVVRSPYPNRCFHVAGTPEHRMGWTIPVDLERLPKGVRFRWKYTENPDRPSHGIQKTITHVIDFKLEGFSGRACIYNR